MQIAAENTFVPADELRRLVVGSYEQLIERVESALRQDSKRCLGRDVSAKVVGTFPGYAIALSEDGAFYRLKFESSAVGDIVIVGSEPLQVTSYAESDLGTYAHIESRSIVDRFLQGRLNEAWSRLAELARLPDTAIPDDSQLTFESVISLIQNGTWRETLTERAVEVRRMLGDSLDKLERLLPKFESLYSESLEESALEGYRPLVVADLGFIGKRLETLTTTADTALALAKEKIAESKDPVIKSFGQFAEGFVSNAQKVQKALSKADSVVSGVARLGQLYDLVAEEMFDFGVASLLVERTAKRICEL